MKISKAQVRRIIREEIQKVMKEDTYHHEEEHDDEDMDHLERIRRELNHHIDNLQRQKHRAEGRHEWWDERHDEE